MASFVRAQDQMEHLERLKVRTESINSKMASSERQRVWTDLQSVLPTTRLLYITPEQADTATFQVGANQPVPGPTYDSPVFT